MDYLIALIITVTHTPVYQIVRSRVGF